MTPTPFQLDAALKRAKYSNQRTYIIVDAPHGSLITGPQIMTAPELAMSGLSMMHSPSCVVGYFEPTATTTDDFKARR